MTELTQRRKFLKVAFLPVYLSFILFLYYQGYVTNPSLKNSGIADIFLIGGLIALALSVLYASFADKFPKVLAGDTLTRDIFGLEDLKMIGAVSIFFFLLATGAARGGMSITDMSVMPDQLYTPATQPSLGVYSYILNAPIEDALIILLPFWGLNVLRAILNLTVSPFNNLLARSAVSGVLAMSLHTYARGGAWDVTTGIMFAVFTGIAYYWGYVVADAAHGAWNFGIIGSKFTAVASIHPVATAFLPFLFMPVASTKLLHTTYKKITHREDKR